MCSHLAFATPASLPTVLVSRLSPLATSRPRLLHSRPRTSVRLSPVAVQTPSSPTSRSPLISNPLKPLVTPATPAVSFTHYSGNSFCLEYTSPTLSRPLRILVDPWLQGDLVFGEGLLGPSFFSAKKALAQENNISVFGTFDAIVLSQNLPDHAHPPTLAALPRHLPVICPESAVALLEGLNYTSIHPVKPRGGRKSFATGTSLDIFSLRTGPGSITGPPWSTPQLAFCFQFREGAGESVKIYFETHGEHDLDFVRELVADGQKLDAVISPVIETTLPVLGNYRIVNGIPEFIELCEVARPRACVPFDNSGTPSSGALSKLVKQKGSQEELREKLAANEGLREIVITEPEIMEKIFVAVKDMS